jgi:hypothetical protein
MRLRKICYSIFNAESFEKNPEGIEEIKFEFNELMI